MNKSERLDLMWADPRPTGHKGASRDRLEARGGLPLWVGVTLSGNNARKLASESYPNVNLRPHDVAVGTVTCDQSDRETTDGTGHHPHQATSPNAAVRI
jgi:hypothetical protein